MHQLLTAQYALAQSARTVLFEYCATLAPADFVTSVPAFNHKSLRDLLLHVANVYQHWLGLATQGQPYAYAEDAMAADLAAVRVVFQEVDALMASYLTAIGDSWQQPETIIIPGRTTPLSLTPLEVFTHVITHEFHHKGQLLSMSRQLGHTPVDTDIIRF